MSRRFSVYLGYFDYPLEQGLRLQLFSSQRTSSTYFDYPLEQGLRQALGVPRLQGNLCILIIH